MEEHEAQLIFSEVERDTLGLQEGSQQPRNLRMPQVQLKKTKAKTPQIPPNKNIQQQQNRSRVSRPGLQPLGLAV